MKLLKKKNNRRQIKDTRQGIGKNGKPNKTKSLQYTREDFQQAIVDSHGVKYTVYKRVGCASKTLEDYLTIYPELQEQLDQEARDARSFVDGKMFKLIEDNDRLMINLFQKTKGGYTEKTQVDHVSSDKSLSTRRHKLSKKEMEKFKEVFQDEF
jgi:hypothetical protein